MTTGFEFATNDSGLRIVAEYELPPTTKNRGLQKKNLAHRVMGEVS